VAKDTTRLLRLPRLVGRPTRPVGNRTGRRHSTAGLLQGSLLHLGFASQVLGCPFDLGLQVPLVSRCPPLGPAVDGHPIGTPRCVAGHQKVMYVAGNQQLQDIRAGLDLGGGELLNPLYPNVDRELVTEEVPNAPERAASAGSGNYDNQHLGRN
jgi:hypothetical protein